MDELKFFAGLAAITIFVISLFVYFGRKLSKAAEKNVAYIDLPLYITRAGTVFFACVVAFWSTALQLEFSCHKARSASTLEHLMARHQLS